MTAASESQPGESAGRQPTPLMTAAWEAATTEPDPLTALGATRALNELLSTWEAQLVKEAVAAGATWEAIGSSVGISRQAAWARFRHDIPEEVHQFHREVRDQARAMRGRQRKEWNEFKDEVRSRAREHHQRWH